MKECFLCGGSLSAPGLKLSRKKLINSRSGFTLKFVFTPKESKKIFLQVLQFIKQTITGTDVS